MPALALLAGPNGAGKTTFLNAVLLERAETFQFVPKAAPSFLPHRGRWPGAYTSRSSRRGAPSAP
jgi:septin family protein